MISLLSVLTRNLREETLLNVIFLRSTNILLVELLHKAQ